MSKLVSVCWLLWFAFAMTGCNSSELPASEAPILEARSVVTSSESDVADEPEPETSAEEPAPLAETSAPSPGSEEKEREDDVSVTVAADDAAKDNTSDWHALLVGCTKYEHLEREAWLRGPSNDVNLMHYMLINKFGLAPDRVSILIEEKDAEHRPTRENIVRELKRLEKETKPGESVFLLFSGHGSQQPDDDPDNPQDVEPDGLDEVFLPADVSVPEDPEDLSIVNGLSDDALREVLTEFRKKGVFVLFVSDSCHSGSSLRGTERYRQLAPERFFSRNLLQRAREKAAAVKSSAGSTEFESQPEAAGEYVAIYAAQPHEPTIELMLPPGAFLSQWRGLLSYTMIKILLESEETLTYRELVQRIHAEYVQTMGRLGPTPLIEGSGQDRIVFGGETTRTSSDLVLSLNEEGEWIIRAGQLHGLSDGAVLAVGPPAGNKQEQAPVGHVRVEEARLSESIVEPVAFEDIPVNHTLPLGGVCRLVQIARNPFTLKVAFEASEKTGERERSITESFLQNAMESGVSVELVDDAQNADWLIGIDDEQVTLRPGSEWRDESDREEFIFNSAEADWIDRFHRTLAQISRASGLLKVSGTQTARRKNIGRRSESISLCDIDVKLVRTGDGDSPQPVQWETSGLMLEAGDVISLQITNNGLYVIDFTALFVDSQYGIAQLFPEPGVVADNRIAPGQEFTVGPMRVDASTSGLEHLIVIASPAKGQPLDWSWLAQPSLELSGTRSAGLKGSLQTSTGALLKNAMFGNTSHRGLQKVEPDDVTMEVISWTTKPEAGN